MTADAPQPQRRTSGSAERPVNYPKTLAIMVSEEMYDALTYVSDDYGGSKAEVARDWLDVGRRVGGDVFIDERLA